jgi:hypothetical protein
MGLADNDAPPVHDLSARRESGEVKFGFLAGERLN